MSTFDLTQKIKVVNPNASNDSQYGPYNSISEALTATQGLRELGRTVGIIESGIITEYWFKEGILDTDLILKESGGGIESVTGDLVDNTDPANPIIETPTLQQVTDEGATTTNPIIVGDGLNQVDINDDGTIDATSNITGGKLAVRNIDGELGSILADSLTDDREHQLQDKDGTLAHLDDILSDAVDIDYDNTTSGLDAENVQELGDELENKKLDKVTTGSTERVYSVNESNNQAMIPTMEQFVSDTDIINALEAITTEIATISVSGKTMYKGQLYVSDSPAYIYLAYDDNQIIRK